MKMIKITAKNFDWIASRIVKFFNGRDIVYWHNFDCGSKRHIQPDFQLFDEGRVRPIYRYSEVECTIVKQPSTEEGVPGRKYIRLRLNNDCGGTINIGDVVGFAGNRLHLKCKSAPSNHKWQYDVYQIWDPNGGFKYMRPSHDDWPLGDYDLDYDGFPY